VPRGGRGEREMRVHSRRGPDWRALGVCVSRASW
jgi:hypothetical protein